MEPLKPSPVLPPITAVPPPKSSLDSRTKLPLLTIPDGDLFAAVEKGFVSFWRLERTMKDPIQQSKVMTSRRVQTEQGELHDTLQSNKQKLRRLNESIGALRNVEYDDYIRNSQRYARLLQLNTRRSRLAATSSAAKNKVGEIKVKQAQQIRPQDIAYTVQLTRSTVKGWKPQSREGQVCIVYKDHLVLLGGHNNAPLRSVCYYSFNSSSWVKSVKTELSRSCHTGILYRGHYVIMFGGMGGSAGLVRDCLSTTCLYDIVSGSYKQIKIANEEIVEARRHHGACIFGKYMIIFGGLSSKSQHLNDLKYLDLKELKWYSKEYKCADEELQRFLEGGLGRHAMVAQFSQRDSYPMYSHEYDSKEGFYIFGGINQSGEVSTLMQLRLNKYTPVMHRLEPSGLPPSPLEPLVNRHNESTFLIISGDRHQREMKLYRCSTNEFIGVENAPQLPTMGGIGSSLVYYRDSYYLLFGVGEHGFISAVTSFSINERKKESPQRLKNKQIMEALRRYSVSQSSDSRPSYRE